MSKQSLRELLDDAESKVCHYRNPNLEEFVQAMSPVMEALGIGRLGDDPITDISQDGDTVHITTSWVARQCSQTSDFFIPVSVLHAPDPILAANKWRLESIIASAQSSMENLRRGIEEHQAKLESAQAELGVLLAGETPLATP